MVPLVALSILAAPAALLGTYAVSFLVAWFAGLVAEAIGWCGPVRPKRLSRGALRLAALALVWTVLGLAFRAPHITESDRPRATFAVVQTNVPQDNKLGWGKEDRENDSRAFAKLTHDAAAARPRPDLIVWPETMFPGRALNGFMLLEVV